MHISHIAIWTQQLEELKQFYVTYFGGESNSKYINPLKGFESYFISFCGGNTSLELMSRKDIIKTITEKDCLGLTHFAFSVGSKNAVTELTERLRKDGYQIVGEPRTTGDGYYESIVLDPDGNCVEITD
ncbi:VOC family protein [uncultured Bacteroides sp.]|uniref:VOC family protein n=1 Tax=uncultured Bacteroides sp. TaxID=162156 RepID=UPI002AAA7867|nr:VOC family protein [uncultured Bacteroides sp.]